MSALGLFLIIIGTAATLVVTVALGLCLWGAILDGRAERERTLAESEADRTLRPLVPVPHPAADQRRRTITPAA